MTTKPYSVVCFNTDTRETTLLLVMANDGLNAFAAAANAERERRAPDADLSDFEMVVALPGHELARTGELEFPGEGLVTGETVLEQPDVFGTPPLQPVLDQPVEQPNQVDTAVANDDLDPPALSQEYPEESGNDYVFNEGTHRGCWIRIRNISAHLFLTPDDHGVQVNLHAIADEGGAEVDELDSVFVEFPESTS